MSATDALTTIRAFAEVHGFELLRKETRNGDTFTISRRIGNIDAPRCPYMSPYELTIWIDGYCAGINAAAPTQAGG